MAEKLYLSCCFLQRDCKFLKNYGQSSRACPTAFHRSFSRKGASDSVLGRKGRSHKNQPDDDAKAAGHGRSRCRVHSALASGRSGRARRDALARRRRDHPGSALRGIRKRPPSGQADYSVAVFRVQGRKQSPSSLGGLT